MPDEKTIAFLKGLRVLPMPNGAVYITDARGIVVADVHFSTLAPGDTVEDVIKEAALALVTAAHEWVTFAKVIEAAKSLVQCAENNDIAIVAAKGVASKFDDSLSALAAAIDTALKEGSDE